MNRLTLLKGAERQVRTPQNKSHRHGRVRTAHKKLLTDPNGSDIMDLSKRTERKVMEMKNAKAIILVVLLVIGALVLSGCSLGNRQIGLDLKQSFDEAIVILHNGEMIEGKVDSWRDFDESDVVQVTVEGVTYLTHYSNIILIRYDNQH